MKNKKESPDFKARLATNSDNRAAAFKDNDVTFPFSLACDFAEAIYSIPCSWGAFYSPWFSFMNQMIKMMTAPTAYDVFENF